MEPNGLVALHWIPDGDQFGHLAEARLAGQVVPAAHGEYRPQPQRLGGDQVIQLRRAQFDERRDEHGVGPLLRQERFERMVRRNGAFEHPEPALQAPRALDAAQARQPLQPQEDVWRALAGPRPQVWRVVVERIDEAQVVERQPEPPRHLDPRARFAALRPAEGETATGLGGQTAHQLLAAEQFPLVRRDVHVVPAAGELQHRGIEVPHVGVVPDQKEDSHQAARSACLRRSLATPASS